MSIIKKTFNLVVKSISKPHACVACKRTEQQLVGSTRVSASGHAFFSPDSLCIDCEIRIHPDRFHGCGFCKRPIRERFSCVICSAGFVEWVKEVIHPIDSLSMIIRQSADKLLDKTIYDLPIEQHRFIMRTEDGYYKWPGFYAGLTNKFSPKRNNTTSQHNETDVKLRTPKSESKNNMNQTDMYPNVMGIDTPNASCIIDSYEEVVVESSNQLQSSFFPVWIIPKLINGFDVNLTDLRLDLKVFQKILLGILKKNNINLYADVQIDLEKMDNLQIKIVNPADTRVMRMF